jgi:hypothetical protein
MLNAFDTLKRQGEIGRKKKHKHTKQPKGTKRDDDDDDGGGGGGVYI